VSSFAYDDVHASLYRFSGYCGRVTPPSDRALDRSNKWHVDLVGFEPGRSSDHEHFGSDIDHCGHLDAIGHVVRFGVFIVYLSVSFIFIIEILPD
jgi:hypothetical protein